MFLSLSTVSEIAKIAWNDVSNSLIYLSPIQNIA